MKPELDENQKGFPSSAKAEPLKDKISAGVKKAWKGDYAGYEAKHMWISKHKGKAKRCELFGCKVDIYHWANISGYHYRNVDDYISLCPKCHSFFDKFNIDLDTLYMIKILFKERNQQAVEWLKEELMKFNQNDICLNISVANQIIDKAFEDVK